MTSEELIAKCSEFETSKDKNTLFAEIIQSAIDLGVGKNLLANDFEVSVSVITSWSVNRVRPNNKKQLYVVRCIRERFDLKAKQ